MRKNIILFLLAFVCGSMYPTHMIYKTCTIDSTNLYALRFAALSAGDPLITQFWAYTQSTRDNENLSEVFGGEREFTNSFGLESRAISLYKAIVSYLENPDANADFINEERDYLFNFPLETFELAIHHPGINSLPQEPVAGEIIPSDWDQTVTSSSPSMWNTLGDYDRARELGYNLIFLSFMADMLYYAHDPLDTVNASKMAVIIANLNGLKNWVHSSFYGYNLDGSDTWDTRGWQINLVYDSDPPLLEVPPKGLCIDVNENMPRFENFVSRYHVTCGLGYASLITGDTQMLNNFVRQEFKSDAELPAGTGFHGFNDYMITKSGMFSAGLTYQNRFMYLSTLFLTALNRKAGINLYDSNNAWNCDMIPRMVRNVITRIDPELQHIIQEDDWRYNGVYDWTYWQKMDHSLQIERGLLSFYYQNMDETVLRNEIAWYVQCLKDKPLSSPNYPRELYENDFKTSLEVVISYRQGCNISSGGIIPNSITSGTYSNEELTIIRGICNSYNEFVQSNMLVVNHENSFTHYHKTSDKTAYQLYLKGKPIIVETGYTPYGNEQIYPKWHQSAFAQNLLLVNPSEPFSNGRLAEAAYLRSNGDYDFEIACEDPFSFMVNHDWKFYNVNPDSIRYNPAVKKFLYQNHQSGMDRLKVKVKYNNYMSEDFGYISSNVDTDSYPCNIERNFYRLGSALHIILDKVSPVTLPAGGNVYRNQINLMRNLVNNNSGTVSGTVSNENYNLTLVPGQQGAYRLDFTGGNLFTGMGTTAPIPWSGGFSIQNQDSGNIRLAWKPYDYSAWGNGYPFGSIQRLSQTTLASSNIKDYFLTVHYLSNSADYTQIAETIQSAGMYGMAINTAGSNIYTGINASDGFTFPVKGRALHTAARFILLDTDASISQVKSMIINGDNSLSVEDLAPGGFGSRIVFDSPYYAYEEVAAEWQNDFLKVT